eukprot:gene16065-18345_t
MIDLIQQLLSKAVISVGDSVATEEKELLQLASRHFRLAAVYTLLGRNHAYQYAAETYKQAAELSRSAVADGSPMTLKLWQNAVAAMRLAADTIAAHTDETSARTDPLITRTITSANQLATNARRILELVGMVDTLRIKMKACKAEAQMCKTPLLIPTLRILAEKSIKFHDVGELLIQALLQEDFDSASAKELEQKICIIETIFTRFQAFALQLCERAQSADYYRVRAAETDSVLHLELRPLLRRCWTKTAEEMEQLTQLIASFLVDGKLDHIARSMHDLNEDFYDAVRGYVYSPIISWRKQVCALVLAAEHLYCAYKYAQLSSAHSQPDAQRISALYKQLATLEILRDSHAYQCPQRYRVDTCLEQAIIDCYIDHIERLSSTSAVVSADKSLRLERVCQFGYQFMHAVHARARSEPMWEKALALYLTTTSQGDYKVREVTPREEAAAAVYVLAAKKIGNHGELLDSICPKAAWLYPASLSNDNATQSVETQMQSIGSSFEDINKTRLEASPLQALLQEQVDRPAELAVGRAVQRPNIYSQIAFSKVAAQCYIEAAKNPHAGVVTALWHDAIEVAKLAELYVEQGEFATTVLRHYARAAYATAENDIELSACWGKAASTARTALIYACKHVAESESLRCTFKHAELSAYACVAQRAGKTDLFGLYKPAAGKWEELGSHLRRTYRLKGRAKEAAQRFDQRLRQEAEEAEHIAHRAARAVGTASEGVTDQINNSGNTTSQLFTAPGVPIQRATLRRRVLQEK